MRLIQEWQERDPKTLAIPEHVTLLMESTNKQKNAYSSGEELAARHDGFGSVVYADGHAKSLHRKKTIAIPFKL
ncbi:MAG: hypothetical protein QM758_24935 [Armatimonas sp.]